MEDANNSTIGNDGNSPHNNVNLSNQKSTEESLFHLFIDYVILLDDAKISKSELLKLLVSTDVTEVTEELLQLRENLKLILNNLKACKGNLNYLDTGSGCQTILHCFLVNYILEIVSCPITRSLTDAKIVKMLVKSGASIVILDDNSNSPLGMAITKRRIDLAQIMLTNCRANLNTQNRLGETALHIIINSYAKSNDNWINYFMYINIIRNLMRRGASANIRDFTGTTPVHIAAKHCFVEILQLFEQFKANFHILTNDGQDLLMVLCYNITEIKDTQALLKAISLLLQQGYNVNLKNKYGFNCLHYAAQTKKLIVLERLIKAGAAVNIIAGDGSTPLHSATMLGTFETVQCLLNHGANPRKRDNVCRFTSLHTAAFNRDHNIVRLISTKVRNLNDLCAIGLSPLHLASAYGNVQVVKELLKLGADVNCQEKIGCHTSLHLASIRGEFSNVKNCLIFSDTYYSLIRKCLKLVKPQKEVSYQVIKVLIKAGADVNVKDSFGRTPLHLASLQPHYDVVAVLLKYGAFVDVQDKNGLLPLHNILCSGNLNGLDCLLRFGADIDVINIQWDRFNEIMNSNKPLANHFLKYVVKLEAANLPISHFYKAYLVDQQWSEYRTQCLDEVAKLKHENVTSTMTYYDLLQRSFRRQYIFINSLPSNLIHKFPIYYSIIKGTYRASRVRKSLLPLAKSVLRSYATDSWPELCSEHIFYYCSNTDLRAIVDSVESECC